MQSLYTHGPSKLLACVLGLSALAAAQTTYYRFSHKPRLRPLAAGRTGAYAIAIPEMGKSRWIVALHAASPASAAECSCNWVKTKASARAPLRMPEEIIEADARLGAGLLRVADPPAAQYELVIWCALPTGAKVHVSQAGGEVFSARLGGDTLIAGGVAYPRSVPNAGQALLALLTPAEASAPAGAIERRAGRLVADWAAVKQHALRLERPDFSSSAPCCGPGQEDAGVPAAAFTLEIRIGEDGKVRAIERILGQRPEVSETMDRLVQAVQRWEFRPFIFEGKPAEVIARIPFTITRSGRVLTPLF